MAFAPGTRLGPYEILTKLAAGGMGEAYRARDGLPDRIVAVNVCCPPEITSPQALERFERVANPL